MLTFTQNKKNRWVCRIGTLEVGLWENAASIKVFADTPKASCIYWQITMFVARTDHTVPTSRDVIAAHLRNALRIKPCSTGNESNDLKSWPQPAAKRFVIEPWRYDSAKEI